MWPFKKSRKKEIENTFCFYSETDCERYEKMISERFGAFDNVFHEIASPDLHIDVIIIPPTEQKSCFTLVTMGMGAYRMPVPQNYGKMNRAEIAIRLPKDWEIQSNEEKWYWPIRVIKTLARMPYNEKSWIGLYHDIDFGEAFSEETELCGILLDIYDEDIEPLTLENGDQLIVYNALPIYRSEMEYKNGNDAEALVSLMDDDILHGPVNVHRRNVV